MMKSDSSVNITNKLTIDSIKIGPRFRIDLGSIDLLVKSIKEVGLLQPVVINEKNELIDGQRRIEAYRMLGRPEIPVYVVNLADIISGEFHANANRKDFTTSERVAIIRAIENFVKENTRIGRPQTKDGEKGAKLAPLFTGKIRDNVASYFEIGHTTLDKETKIVEAAEKDHEAFGEILKRVDDGKLSVDKGYQEVKSLQKKQQTIETMKEHSASLDYKDRDAIFKARIQLIHGNCIEKHKEIPDNSIDLIYTDPPYDRPHLYLYGETAKMAARVLKPGGSLVTFVPQYAFHEVINLVLASGLNWWWPIYVKHAGNHKQMFQRRIFVQGKHLFWFVKGEQPNEKTTTPMPDFIQSEIPDKRTHEMAQSEVEAKHVIRYLTLLEDQIVLDPFMGDGTTGAAAIELKRRFIGIEIDKVRLDNARLRLDMAIPDLL